MFDFNALINNLVKCLQKVELEFNATLFTGNKVGEITSGCPSPSLGNGQNVSMGYVDKKVYLFSIKLIMSVDQWVCSLDF